MREDVEGGTRKRREERGKSSGGRERRIAGRCSGDRAGPGRSIDARYHGIETESEGGNWGTLHGGAPSSHPSRGWLHPPQPRWPCRWPPNPRPLQPPTGTALDRPPRRRLARRRRAAALVRPWVPCARSGGSSERRKQQTQGRARPCCCSKAASRPGQSSAWLEPFPSPKRPSSCFSPLLFGPFSDPPPLPPPDGAVSSLHRLVRFFPLRCGGGAALLAGSAWCWNTWLRRAGSSSATPTTA